MKDNSNFIKKSKSRSTIINILFSFIIFLLFIGTLEILLRTTHLFGAKISWAEPDPLLYWRFTPGRNYWFGRENDHPITGKINSYGWRDKEWSLGKPQNTYRIAVLGDSYVEAFQVESYSTFLTLTEQLLNKDHNLRVELMNFGRSGFTQTEELIVLKNEVLQFSPDMVVVFFTPKNDILDVSKETAVDLNRPFYHISGSGELMLDTNFTEKREFKIKSFINRFKQHSALISFFTQRYNIYKRHKRQKRARAKNIPKTKNTITLPKEIDRYLSLCTATPDAAYLRSYQLNKILIKAMSDYSKEKGIRFMLVTIDIPSYIPEIEKRYKYIDLTFDANFFEDDLRSYAGLLKIEYIGLQRIFRQFYENTGVPLHWGHWNYEGHKVVANALADKLESIIYSKEQGE